VAVNDLLTQQVPGEHEETRKKIPPLRENGPVVTDISHSTHCAALEDTTDCGIALGYFGLGGAWPLRAW
jgi:hypothetical protein